MPYNVIDTRRRHAITAGGQANVAGHDRSFITTTAVTRRHTPTSKVTEFVTVDRVCAVSCSRARGARRG